MADSGALRTRRATLHKRGDHSLCRPSAPCTQLRVAERAEGFVSAMHRAELEQLGLAQSAEGAIVLALAGILDDQKGAVGAAATADRLDRLMDRLRRRTPSVATPLDELRERRKRRGA